jgi:hypothetical protein
MILNASVSTLRYQQRLAVLSRLAAADELPSKPRSS